jgi:hypothetical protein
MIVMTFEFHGADLETAEGQDALLTVLPLTFNQDGDFSQLMEEIDERYDQFDELAKTNFEAFKSLANKALESPDSTARILAGRLTMSSAVIDPDFTTDLIVSSLSDESPLVRKSVGWVLDAMTGYQDTWTEEFESLGMMRLAKIAKAYKESL